MSVVVWWLLGGLLVVALALSVVSSAHMYRKATAEDLEDESIHHVRLARTYELRNDMQQAAYHRLQAAELAESAKRYRRRGTK